MRGDDDDRTTRRSADSERGERADRTGGHDDDGGAVDDNAPDCQIAAVGAIAVLLTGSAATTAEARPRDYRQPIVFCDVSGDDVICTWARGIREKVHLPIYDS